MAAEDDVHPDGDPAGDDANLQLVEDHPLASVQEEGVNTHENGETGHIGSYTGPEEEEAGNQGPQLGADDASAMQQAEPAAIQAAAEEPAGSQQGSRPASQQASRQASRRNSGQGSQDGLRPSSATRTSPLVTSRPGSAQAATPVAFEATEQTAEGDVQQASAGLQHTGSRQTSRPSSAVQRPGSAPRASNAASVQRSILDAVQTPADSQPSAFPAVSQMAADTPQAPDATAERPMTAATDASGGSSLRSTGLWTLGLGQAPATQTEDAAGNDTGPAASGMSVTEGILTSIGKAEVLTELQEAMQADNLRMQHDAPGKNDTPDPSQYVIPDLKAVDVHVDQGPGLPQRIITVYMDYSQRDSKAYLGGYRNKRTSTAYHHACTQTPKAPKYAGAEPKLERQTQTVKIKTCSIQTVREASTQMERPGVVIDTTFDVEKLSGKYQTSEERLAIVMAATQTIQRWLRGWMGRKRAAYLRAKKQERDTFLQEQEAKAQQAAEEHRRKEIERRMHPRTAADFEILYNELEAWRLQETRKIKDAQLPPDKEHELLQQLLHKETKLLQTIDRLKINANHENKDKRIQHTLGDMSKPKLFELKNGKKVQVHTPFTTRAKELMQLNNGLNLPDLTIDERLDVLLHVKWTVKEFDCNLTREIVSLIDREADLLNRGRNPIMMEGLRKRISSMFLNFIETPEFNPEAARYQVVPMDFEQYMFDKLEKSSAKQAVALVSTNSKWDV